NVSGSPSPRARAFAIVSLQSIPDHHWPDALARLGPVKALASLDPQGRAGGLDWALGRPMSWLSRDGRAVMRTCAERSRTDASPVDHTQHHGDDRPPHAHLL